MTKYKIVTINKEICIKCKHLTNSLMQHEIPLVCSMLKGCYDISGKHYQALGVHEVAHKKNQLILENGNVAIDIRVQYKMPNIKLYLSTDNNLKTNKNDEIYITKEILEEFKTRCPYYLEMIMKNQSY